MHNIILTSKGELLGYLTILWNDWSLFSDDDFLFTDSHLNRLVLNPDGLWTSVEYTMFQVCHPCNEYLLHALMHDTLLCSCKQTLLWAPAWRVLREWVCANTGGKGSITQWVHAEYMVGSETIHLAFTYWVRGGYFLKVPTKVPTG